MAGVTILRPGLAEEPSHLAALRAGWSPDNLWQAVAQEQVALVASDARAFIAHLRDPGAQAGPVTLPDGSSVARLPGITRWVWGGVFWRSVNLRWQPGTAALPDHVLGHVGFPSCPESSGAVAHRAGWPC